MEQAVPRAAGLYEVKEGDTVQSVSAACRVPAAALIAANGLTEFPPPGSILVIPAAEGETYIVRAGDTLFSLCQKFAMAEAEFVRLNGPLVYPTQRVWVWRPPRKNMPAPSGTGE